MVALPQTLTALFIIFVGLIFLYIAFKRKAITWYIIADVVFGSSVINGMNIPFKVDVSGQVIGTSANWMLAGVSLIFLILSSIKTIQFSFEFVKDQI